jgi:hypothetical protein
MQQEFIFEDKVYRIRSQLDLTSPNEEPILFRDLASAQAFFRSVAKNRLACEDLLEAAKWLGISNPGIYNKKIPQTAQAVLEQLCLKLWRGDILLVEIKPFIWFEKCCIKSLDSINVILKSSKALGNALLPSKLVLLLWYPLKAQPLVGIVSTAVGMYGIDPSKISANDWQILAKSILDVPKITRERVSKIAEYETIKHEFDNKRELQHFWKGIYDTFV